MCGGMGIHEFTKNSAKTQRVWHLEMPLEGYRPTHISRKIFSGAHFASQIVGLCFGIVYKL